jgi:riboflavin kinase/FMN adenylyltransferase
LELKEKSIEVNLFNFDRDIYDKIISVDVVEKIRDEKKFSSIEDLKTQLSKDEEYCLKLINK